MKVCTVNNTLFLVGPEFIQSRMSSDMGNTHIRSVSNSLSIYPLFKLTRFEFNWILNTVRCLSLYYAPPYWPTTEVAPC